jgi:integrase
MLSKMIKNYIELKHAMGFKFRVQNCLLQNFSEFAKRKGDNYVRNKTVLEWAKQAPSSAQSRNRLLTVRRFALAMQAEDNRNEIPPSDAFGKETFKRRLPYILSSEELNRMLAAALELKPSNTIRPITYATLFSLVAVTGLRISEAIALNLKDITTDGLIIRATKFRKSRLVPLHETTRHAIKRYINFRIQCSGIEDSLFISNHGKRLCYSTVRDIFKQLARSVGLGDKPGNRSSVCIHDLRHRFAVISLEQCISDRSVVSQHMLALSTYLGHAHISDTYWYCEQLGLMCNRQRKYIFYKGLYKN